MGSSFSGGEVGMGSLFVVMDRYSIGSSFMQW